MPGVNDNFVDINDITPEQRAECGRKGGIASGEAKSASKTIVNTLNSYLK